MVALYLAPNISSTPFVCLRYHRRHTEVFLLDDKKMKIDAIQIIKDKLTMSEVVERYGYSVDRKGFMCCPFHNEKTPSMKIYDRDFHCFGCQQHGDVITFVQRLFNLDFKEALNRIDMDFAMGLSREYSFDEFRKAQMEQRALKAKKEREKREKEKAEEAYWKVFDEWKRLDDNRRIYRPKSPDEELNPLFVESLQKLDYQKYVLDCAETEVRRYE